LKLARNRLLTLEVRIGNIPTTAIIDTGAQQTMGNLALREMLSKRAKDPRTYDIIGVTMDVVRGEAIATPPVSFGDVVIHGLHVTFTDVFIFEHWKLTKQPILLIGMDVLGLLDAMVIDYKKRELHVRARR
jgi:hypothetical protein